MRKFSYKYSLRVQNYLKIVKKNGILIVTGCRFAPIFSIFGTLSGRHATGPILLNHDGRISLIETHKMIIIYFVKWFSLSCERFVLGILPLLINYYWKVLHFFSPHCKVWVKYFTYIYRHPLDQSNNLVITVRSPDAHRRYCVCRHTPCLTQAEDV